MEDASQLDIYVKIVSFVTPILIGALWWLTSNHFNLKERVGLLEHKLDANDKADDVSEEKYGKLWDAICEINKTLASIRVISERISK